LNAQTALIGSQFDEDLLGDVLGDFILQGKNVLQVAFIAPGHQLGAPAGFTNCACIPPPVLPRTAGSFPTATTFKSGAICGRVSLEPLNCIAEVREMMRREPIWARSVVKASVIPSAKYSCSLSPERFSSGSTASEWIAGETSAARCPVRGE